MRGGAVRFRWSVALILAAVQLTGGKPQEKPAPDPTLVALAERLDAAASDEARGALLDQSPALVGSGLYSVCMDRGQNFAQQFKPDGALASYRSALAVALRLTDSRQIALAWRAVGQVHNRRGHPNEALD